jgi:hypothetical protein
MSTDQLSTTAFWISTRHSRRGLLYRDSLNWTAVKLRLKYGRLSVGQSLGVGPSFAAHDQIFSFSSLDLKLYSFWSGMPFLTRGQVCTLHCRQSLVQVTEDRQPYSAVSLQTSTAIPVGTSFPFRCILWLSGTRLSPHDPRAGSIWTTV